jgi:hypothetical protein
MKEMAIIEEDGTVVDIIYCDDNREETQNLKSFSKENPAYIGGDYHDGFFYPKKFNHSWIRDGRGSWIVNDNYKTQRCVEDIWCKKEEKIIGKINRLKNNTIKRYDINNLNTENYELINVNKLDNDIIIKKYNEKDFSDVCLLSKNVDGVVTDYYFGIVIKDDIRISNELIQRYNLNKDLAILVRTVGIRYDCNGNFLGFYYDGGFKSLVKTYLKYSDHLKNKIIDYYSNLNIVPYKCIVKDFDDGAIYVVYSEPEL